MFHLVETLLSELTSNYECSDLSEEKPSSRKSSLAVIAGLIIVVILGLGFVAYASMNVHVVTVTQQQYLTNTQNQFTTQTVTSVSTATSAYTVTAYSVSANAVNTVGGYPYAGSGYYPGPNCGAYGCSPPSLGAYGSLCQSTGQNQTVSCSGYLSESTDGCIQLAIPYINPDLLESTAYQFYTLRNAPSSLPSAGSWITVTGQLGQGYTPGTNGAACPGNYINVNTVSP